MDLVTARSILAAQAQAQIYPLLSDDELGDLLDQSLRWTTWQASHHYHYGDAIVPTVPNGHQYRALSDGTSADREPFWPLYGTADSSLGRTKPWWDTSFSTYFAALVKDGPTLEWSEDGPMGDRWDLDHATYLAWMQKAAKASSDYSLSSGGDSLQRQQVLQNCLVMADRYATVRIG